MPTDRFQRAQVLQWLFFEQYSHEPYIASVRYLVMHPDVADRSPRDSRFADATARI